MLPPSISVALHTAAPGAQQLAPCDAHVVRVFAGPPAAGRCGYFGHRIYVRGDVDVFPLGSRCAWHDDAETTVLRISIAPALVHRVARALGRDPGRAVLRARHKLREPRIEHVAWALAEHADAGGLFADSLGIALVAQLLGEPAPPSPAASREHEIAARATSVIDAQLDRPITVAWLARELAISPTHLKRVFRRATGLPIHAYVVQQRVERARQLLATSELGLAEIALAAGFAHQSHMARWIRRLLDVSPHTLRPSRE
jgi:AraC family transcriptional regulator